MVTSYFFKLCRLSSSSASLALSPFAAAASASATIWAEAAAACSHKRTARINGQLGKAATDYKGGMCVKQACEQATALLISHT